jgi:L-alanine-DL-glutamate epimerase-like enolase superfamily enzyme
MPRDSSPTIKEFKVRAVRVPMTEPHRTASGVITESPLVLTDVITDTGISGHSMVFTYTPAALKPTAQLICNLEPLVKGELLAPIEIEQKLAKRFRLLGTQGLVGIALAAIDMALWDALARVHSVSLVRLLGGRRSLFAPTAQSAMTASKVAREPPKAGRREDLQESKQRSATRPCKRTLPL